EESAPAIKKGKKFPWLIVALVVVAGGAAVYFLVLKKKKYTLTVTVGEGVTGTPAAGTSTNEKGTVVNYNYSLQSGYDDLSVTLDGAPVAASGTVTMNANHTLEAKAIKTFVLTVSRGEHVTGTPVSGTYSYARGTNVTYSYAPASGYSGLEVKIDSVAADAAGTIAMDANHTLTANLQGANIEVNSTPAGAKIYMNNVDSGHTTPYSFFFSTAVTKTVLLRYSCGYKDYTQTVSASLGQTKTINATLVAGIRENFSIPASICWHPYYSASWSTSGGYHKYAGAAPKWSPSVYYKSFSGDYTITVRMNRKKGTLSSSNSIFLGTGTSMTNASGYLLQYQSTGNYSIYRPSSFNFITGTGSITAIKSWTASSAIQTGLNKWNILKIVKVGSNYSFYINSTLMYSFNDATYNPSYCVLIFFCGTISTEMLYDYVYLDTGAGAGSLPGQPVKNLQLTGKEKDEMAGRL
ncbi:MAG: PEGA domain-containing protein, partial [Candidatus Aminicenantes bacterium]|nr:PEGA domain-containing protein [Candidatus Aminicenantes bacterium]